MNAITGILSEARPAGPGASPKTQRVEPATTTAQTSGQSGPATGTTVREITVELPEITAGKLRLTVDDTTGRVVGKVIDRNSGELLWQVPSDDMLRLIAATEELLGPLYSTEA